MHATFSPDSQFTSTVDQDGNILIHDLATAKVRLQKNLHHGMVLGSSFCHEDGNLLATAGYDGFIRILDLREQTGPPPAWQLPSTRANWASSGGAGSCIDAAHGGYAVHALEFTGSSTIISGGADCKVKRWDLRMVIPGAPKAAIEYLGHTSSVRSLCVSGDGRFLVSGCEDGSCRVWQQNRLGTLKEGLKAIRAELQHLDAQVQDTSLPPEKRRALESRRQSLRQQLSEDKASAGHLERDGYCQAVKCLTGHVSQVSGCAWQEDGKGSVSILSSSWDQSIQLVETSLTAFA